MSKSLLVWLGGMLSLLGGQRLFVSSDTVSIALTVLGLAALVVGLVFGSVWRAGTVAIGDGAAWGTITNDDFIGLLWWNNLGQRNLKT